MENIYKGKPPVREGTTAVEGRIVWRNIEGNIEKYRHQDGNFDNQCSFPFCRCHD